MQYLKEDGKIKGYQLQNADKRGLQLRGARQPCGAKRKSIIEWLDEFTATYYHQLLTKNSYDFITGHVP